MHRYDQLPSRIVVLRGSPVDRCATDLRTGASHFELLMNSEQVASWAADATLPPAGVRPLLNGQTSTQYTAHGVQLKPGDGLELRGVPDLTVHTQSGQDAAGRAPGLQAGGDARACTGGLH